MTAGQLLHDLRRAGVSVALAAGDATALDIEGPQAAMSPDRLNRIRQCKPELLVMIRRRDLRRRAAEQVRRARRQSAGEAITLRDAWRERMAACTIDGGLTEAFAERVAWDELENLSLLLGKRRR